MNWLCAAAIIGAKASPTRVGRYNNMYIIIYTRARRISLALNRQFTGDARETEKINKTQFTPAGRARYTYYDGVESVISTGPKKFK